MSESGSSFKADLLIIDDTPENLTLLAEMLKQQNYKVRSATKGSTALRGAQAAPPDLILLDVNMPEMNGYEVCQQLKADDRTRSIPVIFISALGDVLDKVKAFQVGGVDYITKPFQLEEVQARIETHLTICRLQQQLQTQNTLLQQEIRERQQAEEKFAKVFRASPHPIAIATLSEGRLVDVNPSFLRMAGYTLEEVIGHTLAELQLGIDAETYNNAVQQLLQTGALHNQEWEFRSKSGQLRIVLLSIERIDLAGAPCTLNLVNDITQRKRLENEFISLVSHELRTPLSSLMGSLDVLGTGQLGQLNDQGQKVLNIAVTSTERLTRLVNDILDLERMKAGKITLHPERCDLAQVMTQATEAMQAMADRAQIQLITQPLSVEIWADPDRLIQALTNLLNNAIKFSDGGKSVELRAILESRDSTPTQTVLITIRDQGRGIPADKLDLIFDRFQQVDSSDSRRKGGTGLGLAICRSIVEQLNGKIWVESQLGQGSTFYVRLPLEQQIAQP